MAFVQLRIADAILRELEQLLLELGAGFSLVARQKRLQVEDDDFYVGLLFYNRKLRRLVAVELKSRRLPPRVPRARWSCSALAGQRRDQEAGENPPLGIILRAGKKQEQIELLELDKSGMHVASTLTVLPARGAAGQVAAGHRVGAAAAAAATRIRVKARMSREHEQRDSPGAPPGRAGGKAGRPVGGD
jgi:hypothetical protein